MEETKTQEYVRILPPVEMFEAEALPAVPRNNAQQQGQLTTPVTHIHTPEEGGVLVYHEGDLYPVKGLPFREAIYACDTIKRAIINIIKFATSSPVRYLIAACALLPNSIKRKIVRKALEEFTDYTELVFNVWGRIMEFGEGTQTFGLQGVKWKPQFYCDMVREFRRVALDFAGDDPVYLKLVDAVSMILEFDDAYRYFTQDLLGELNPVAFMREPGEELKRLLDIAQERGQGTRHKFERVSKLIPTLFKLTPVRRMARAFVSKLNLQKMKLDEADEYRCYLWGGWKFKGISDIERCSMRLMIDTAWEATKNKGQNTTLQTA